MASENISILVVEDEPAIAELVSFSVKTAGWTPVTVYTGTEAWTALQRFRPDMVLLDWMLPDLSGMRLLMKIREHKDMKTLPVIMLTAKRLRRTRSPALTRGRTTISPSRFLRKNWSRGSTPFCVGRHPNGPKACCVPVR